MRRPKKANGPRGNASSDKSASVKLPSLKSTELSGRQRVRRHHNDHEFLQLKHALEKQEKENAKLKAENDQLKANALNFHEKLHKVHDEERHLEEELVLEGSLFAQQTKEDEKKFKSMARKILEKEMDLRRLKIEFSKVKDDLRGVNSQLVTAQEDLKQTIQEANNLKELSKTLALKISRLQYRDPKEFSGERLAARRYARAGEASSGARPKARARNGRTEWCSATHLRMRQASWSHRIRGRGGGSSWPNPWRGAWPR